jgi:hypothetical protein
MRKGSNEILLVTKNSQLKIGMFCAATILNVKAAYCNVCSQKYENLVMISFT